MMERIRETFNDGILVINEQQTIRNSQRVKTGTTLVPQARLHYRRMVLRDADVQMIGQGIASKVTRKLKTILHPLLRDEDFKNTYFVTINGDSFNTLYVDWDKNYSYLYLEKVGGQDGSETTISQAK